MPTRRRRALATALAALALTPLAGCGESRPEPDLRSDRLLVVDWKRAAPRALCQTEQDARATPGRTAVRTGPERPSNGRECWIAIDTTGPVATGADVRSVADAGDRTELRFLDAPRQKMIALGPEAHVGVVYKDRLLDVVFPQGGRVRILMGGSGT